MCNKIPWMNDPPKLFYPDNWYQHEHSQWYSIMRWIPRIPYHYNFSKSPIPKSDWIERTDWIDMLRLLDKGYKRGKDSFKGFTHPLIFPKPNSIPFPHNELSMFHKIIPSFCYRLRRERNFKKKMNPKEGIVTQLISKYKREKKL